MRNRNRAVRAASSAVVEAMEDRRLFAVAFPDGYVFVETKTLSATNGSFQSFNTPMEVGADCFIIATGTARIGNRTDTQGHV